MDLLLLGLAGLGLLHAANSEVRRFERVAAADFASLLEGEGKRVHVQAKVGPEGLFGEVHAVRIRASQFQTDGLPLFAEPSRSTKGHVRSLRIELEDFVLTGLSVRRLTADIPDCRFDFSYALRHKKVRLSRGGIGIGEVEVTEKDLERFVQAKYPDIKRCTLRLDKDKVIFEGRAETRFLKADFWVAARLEPSEGTKIVLAFPRMLLNGKVADEGTRNLLLKLLNPVIDLDRDLKLHGAVKAEQVTLRDGLLRARGVVTIPDRPKD